MIEWTTERVNKCVSQRLSEWPEVCMSEKEWLNEWVSEQVSKRMNEQVSVWVLYYDNKFALPKTSSKICK